MLSQATVRGMPEARRQITVDLVLRAGQLTDADGDRVPDSIDNCVFLSNSTQTDLDADGVGDPCSGSDGGIRGGAPNGNMCTADTGCDSRHCVDGICCDSDCVEPCHSCVLPGARGTCTAIAAGQDSQGDCPEEAPATCGRTGKCSATSTCALYADGQPCAVAACAASSQSSARSCDGAGACRPAVMTACGIYACNGAVCAASCGLDTHCAAGYYCVGARLRAQARRRSGVRGRESMHERFLRRRRLLRHRLLRRVQELRDAHRRHVHQLRRRHGSGCRLRAGFRVYRRGRVLHALHAGQPRLRDRPLLRRERVRGQEGRRCGVRRGERMQLGLLHRRRLLWRGVQRDVQELQPLRQRRSMRLRRERQPRYEGPNPCGPPNRCDGAGICQ